MAVHFRSHQNIFVGGWWLSHHVNISSFDVWISYHYWWGTNILIDGILYRCLSVVQLPLKSSKEQRRQGFLRVAAHPLQPVELQSVVSVSWCFSANFSACRSAQAWIISMFESKNDHQWWVISACKTNWIQLSWMSSTMGKSTNWMETFMNFPPATTMG